MKKILLLAVVVLTLFSCDKNKDSLQQIPGEPYVKYLKVQVNGTENKYDNILTQKEYVPNSGDPYTDVIVTAKKTNDPLSKITFRIAYMQSGTETCYYFLYDSGGIEYDIENNNSFEINLTKSTATKIMGVFHGLLYDFQNNPIMLTNGSFEISID